MADISFEDIIKRENIKKTEVQFSTRMKKSWRMSMSITGNRILILPIFFKNAPEKIKYALIRWSQLNRPFRKKKMSEYLMAKKAIEKQILNYMNESTNIPEQIYRSISYKKLNSYNTLGIKYDLKEVFNTVNCRYFDGKIVSYLRWGKPQTRTSYNNSYIVKDDNSKIEMITIADIYNRKFVPDFAIECIMYHEMLHIAVKPYIKNGRRVVHGSEFKAAEKINPDFERWNRWLKEVASRKR